MSLERVLNFAAGQGSSLIPRTLLPDGFECWPAEDAELRMSRVARYAGQLLNDGLALAVLGDAEAGIGNLQKWSGGAGKSGVRHVATPGGARMYKAPIGTPITAKMRYEAQQQWGKAHESRQHAREGGEVGKQASDVRKAVAQAGGMPGMPPEPTAPGVPGAAEGAAAGAATPQAPGAGLARKAAAAPKATAKTGPGGARPGGKPKAIGGHQIQHTYSHPKSPRVIHDLGHGLHAEEEPGKPPGGVMRSATGIQEEAFKAKGWTKGAPGAGTPAAGLHGAGARARASAPSKTGKMPDEIGGPAGRIAAEGAARTAIAKSGMMDDARYAKLEKQIADLQQQLEHTHEKAHEVGTELEESHRVSLAVSLLGVAAEITFAALAGGLLGPLALLLTVPFIVKTAEPLIEFHGSKHNLSRDILSHPVKQTKKAKQVTAKTVQTKKVQAKQALAKRPLAKKVLPDRMLAATMLLELAAQSPEAGGLQSRTAAVLRAALAYHGVPAETAKQFADQAAATGAKNATAHLVKQNAKVNGVKL